MGQYLSVCNFFFYTTMYLIVLCMAHNLFLENCLLTNIIHINFLMNTITNLCFRLTFEYAGQ